MKLKKKIKESMNFQVIFAFAVVAVACIQINASPLPKAEARRANQARPQRQAVVRIVFD